MDPCYSERYRTLFEKHWWWRARTEYIVERLRDLRPATGWRNILDIGCGDALFFNRLSEFGDVEGIEPSAELVDPQNPHRNRIFIRPFDKSFQPAKRYSLILMLDVLEHLDARVDALRQVCDLLEPDGTFIATVPAFMSLWTSHDWINHHRTRYTKSTLSAEVQASGLRIEQMRYLYHWTVPVKYGMHFAENVLGLRTKPAVAREGWVNDALYRLSRVEQETALRLSIPFGSSLFLAARGE